MSPVILSIDFDFFVHQRPDLNWKSTDHSFSHWDFWILMEKLVGDPELEFPFDYVSFRKTQEYLKQLPREVKILSGDCHSLIYWWVWYNFPKVDIVNLDAHHDLGYGDLTYPSEENWAFHLLSKRRIGAYRLYYPGYRQISPETSESNLSMGSIEYGLQFPDPPTLVGVFLCRSSGWVPPIYDYLFNQLEESSGSSTNLTPRESRPDDRIPLPDDMVKVCFGRKKLGSDALSLYKHLCMCGQI